MHPVHTANTPRYVWGNQCDGWRLADGETLSVIEEVMPPGTNEARHHHRLARQFFYVLAGGVTMEVGHEMLVIGQGQGIEIAPGTEHRICNESADPVRFLVISAPTTRGDRVESPATGTGA